MTPLHINIAIHYHTRIGDRYAENEPQHANSDAVARYKNDLCQAGLLEPTPAGDFRATDGCKAYVAMLCEVPLPVRKWCRPEPDEAGT